MRKWLLLVLSVGCRQPPAPPPPPPSQPAAIAVAVVVPDASVESPDAGPPDAGILLIADDGGIVEQEPNDVTPQAVDLPLLVKGLIWPRKDVDVFRFHVPA